MILFYRQCGELIPASIEAIKPGPNPLATFSLPNGERFTEPVDRLVVVRQQKRPHRRVSGNKRHTARIEGC